MDDRVSDRFKEHVTAALEQEPGALYDWMCDIWCSEFDVAAFTLQEGVIPKDHAMPGQYWIDQFAGLLHAAGNGPGTKHSAVARQVIAATQEHLARARNGEKGQAGAVTPARSAPCGRPGQLHAAGSRA